MSDFNRHVGMADAGHEQFDGGKGSPLRDEGHTQCDGGNGSPLSDYGARQGDYSAEDAPNNVGGGGFAKAFSKFSVDTNGTKVVTKCGDTMMKQPPPLRSALMPVDRMERDVHESASTSEIHDRFNATPEEMGMVPRKSEIPDLPKPGSITEDNAEAQFNADEVESHGVGPASNDIEEKGEPPADDVDMDMDSEMDGEIEEPAHKSVVGSPEWEAEEEAEPEHQDKAEMSEDDDPDPDPGYPTGEPKAFVGAIKKALRTNDLRAVKGLLPRHVKGGNEARLYLTQLKSVLEAQVGKSGDGSIEIELPINSEDKQRLRNIITKPGENGDHPVVDDKDDEKTPQEIEQEKVMKQLRREQHERHRATKAKLLGKIRQALKDGHWGSDLEGYIPKGARTGEQAMVALEQLADRLERESQNTGVVDPGRETGQFPGGPDAPGFTDAEPIVRGMEAPSIKGVGGRIDASDPYMLSPALTPLCASADRLQGQPVKGSVDWGRSKKSGGPGTNTTSGK